MKKFAVAVAFVVLVAFAAPAVAATNPFMDVPMNHWAYDAIGQLAAHGILSGYPDGTYKGKQPTTRYEMASALARALAVVDMTKASKQDVEMMKKLIVEFRDELEALGVKVAELDDRVKVLEDRLGGWHIHGQFRLDIDNRGDRDAPQWENRVRLQRARLFFERTFGEDDEMFFRARLDNTNSSTTWEQFYVTMPFYFDTKLYVGRFLAWEEMEPYYISGGVVPNTGGFVGLDDILGDYQVTGIGFEKNFTMGSVKGYVAHPTTGGYNPNKDDVDLGAWALFLMANIQFTEQFGFDVGGHAFIGDNATWISTDRTKGWDINSLWTVFAGLRFNFNEHIAFKGIYYHQKNNRDAWNSAANAFRDDSSDSNHWRVIVDVDQEMLKFTSLWLEYGQFTDGGFFVPAGASGQGAVFVTDRNLSGAFVPELKYWRVALGQQWNEKWNTHLFYYGYNFEGTDDDLKEFGLGVQYTYNPSVKFGLNFVKADWDESPDDHMVKFRTEILF